LIKQGAKLVENANDILKELSLSFREIYPKKIEGKTPEEQLILEILKQENLHIDKIIEKTKLSPQIISSILTLMEIENKVKNLGGNVYALMR
jgi:DNA processing protein